MNLRASLRVVWVPALVLLVLLVPTRTGHSAETSPEPTFPVTIEVDFGPAGQEAVSKEVRVPKGATAEIALREICEIQKGATCCDPREVSGIQGVAVDPAQNRWWTVAINGSRKVSPYKTELAPNDHILWKYIEFEQ